MKKTLLLLTSTLGLFGILTSQAQHTSIPKLEVAKGTVYLVGPENTLHVDTLIMHDKAVIQFAPALQGEIVVQAAYIGRDCTITAKGKDGEKGQNGNHGAARFGQPGSTSLNGEDGLTGTDGEAGGSLNLKIHFATLGMLTIDTRGGYGGEGGIGGNGYMGQNEEYGQRVVKGEGGTSYTETFLIRQAEPGGNGGDAAWGGKGGAGGNISLTYSTNGVLPRFNRSTHSNNIYIMHTAGQHGKNGRPGKGGKSAVSGIAVQGEVPPSPDGKLQLVNANNL